MNAQELAFDFGRRLAFAKHAQDDQDQREYVDEIDHNHPMLQKLKQYGGTGMGVGALMGLLGTPRAGEGRGNLGHRLVRSVGGGAGRGLGIGLSLGALHGAYNSGMSHSYNEKNDSPTTESALVNMLLSQIDGSTLYGGLASELGKSHGENLRLRRGQ